MKTQRFVRIVLMMLMVSVCGVSEGAETIDRAMAQYQEPNLYELKGMGIEITYSITSISGQPQLTYKDRKRSLTFRGDEIRQVESEVGQQITVTLEQVPDLKTETLTLILPEIHLEDTEVFFQTYVLFTTHRTSIGGPDLVKGPLQAYRTKMLKGKARTVTF